MSKGKRAFETLETDDQKALMDIASALAVIVTRLPGTQQTLTLALLAEYARTTGVGLNVANYAMQDLWYSLFDQDWQFIVTKHGDELVTQFIPARTGEGDNGEQTPERSRIITPGS
jgi:hypothetical protein